MPWFCLRPSRPLKIQFPTSKKLGLELDLTSGGMGVRMKRCSMLVDDGVVKTLNVEVKGFEVSNAETMLGQV